MNRRGFLKVLGLGVAAAAVAPSALLEPAKTYFLPPAGGWKTSWGSWTSASNPGGPQHVWLHKRFLEGDITPEGGFDWTPDLDAYPHHKEALDAAVQNLADKIDADALRLYERVYAPENGITIRYMRSDDPEKLIAPVRLDVLFGFAAVVPQHLGVVIAD